MSTILGLIGSVIVFAVFIVLIMWACAEVGFLWKFIARNRIVLTDKGEGVPYKVHFYNELRWLGIQWIGFPPVEIHKFPLRHRRLNKEITKDTAHHSWLVRDPEPTMEEFLMETVVHWTYVPGLEFKGGQRADILFQYQATVAEKDGAQTAVYDREGKFFEIMDSLVESNAISLNQMRDMSYDQFMGIEKDENSPLMDNCTHPGSPNGLLQEVNKTAAELSGYELDSISVYRFDASSETEQELALEKKKAQIQAAVAKIKAKGDVTDVTEIIRVVKKELPNADHTAILQAAERLGIIKRLADTNIQSLGGALLGLQPNNNKPGGKKRK